MLSVPLPKGIDKKNIPYLLHKAIFYHLLEMKDENPLYKTA